MPQCRYVKHGLEYFSFYVQKHREHLAACYGPPADLHRAARGRPHFWNSLNMGLNTTEGQGHSRARSWTDMEYTYGFQQNLVRHFGKPHTRDPTQLLKELQCLSLETRCSHQLMCITYKIFCGLVTMPPANLVKPQYTARGYKCEQILNVLVPTRMRFCYIFGVNLNGTNPVMIL